MKISVSGIVGSGKSTIAKLLAEKLSYDYYSVGGFMREIAEKRKMQLSELSIVAEKNREIDDELDDLQKKLIHKDNLVMDSRLGFYFLPDSYKIFLTVTLDKASQRIFNASRGVEKYNNLEECKDYLKKRINSEKIRYKKYYNINFPDLKKFDLIIDTTNKTPEEVLDEILGKMKNLK